MSLQIPSCLWERYKIIQKGLKNCTSKIREFQSDEYVELSGTDGEPIEFEWNLFPGFTSFENLREIQKDLKARQMHPEQFEGKNSVHVDVQ